MAIDAEKLKGKYMPRFSWDYEHRTLAEHWFLMALAYQESSHHLFSEMIERKLADSFHHAKVAASLLEHAVELFLKAGIAQAGKEIPTPTVSTSFTPNSRTCIPARSLNSARFIEQMLTPPRAYTGKRVRPISYGSGGKTVGRSYRH